MNQNHFIEHVLQYVMTNTVETLNFVEANFHGLMKFYRFMGA